MQSPPIRIVQRHIVELWPNLLWKFTSLVKFRCEISKHRCGRKEDKTQTLNQPVGVVFQRLHRRVSPVTHHSDPFTFPSDQSDFSITRQWFTGSMVITNHCWNAIPENEITCLLVLWEGSSWMVDRTLDWESGDTSPRWPWHRFPRVAYLLWPQFLHLKVRCWTTSNLSFDIQRIYNIKLFSMRVFLLGNSSQSVCYQILSAWHYRGGHGN